MIVSFIREREGNLSVYSHGNNVGGFSGPKDVLDEIMQLQKDAEKYREQQTKQYQIGALTMEHVFAANGMCNMYDLQRVLDCMEVELEKKMRDPAGIFNLGVEKAAEKVDQVWRYRRGVINCTELCAMIRLLKKGGEDAPEFVEVVPVPAAIKEQAENEELLGNLFPYADNTPLICETTSYSEDVNLTQTATGILVSIEPAMPFMQFDGKPGEIGGTVTIDPASLDWHYVECVANPNGKSLSGWFPTSFLAHRHVMFWPKHMRDHMVVKPRSNVDPGIALYFPEQAGSDVLRETNEFLATCGVAKVGLGERYFPEPANFVPKDKATQDQMAAVMLAKGDNGQVAEAVAHFKGAPALKTNQEWRAADPEVLKLRAELGAMAKLLHGMPPQRGSLVARLEALVDRAAEMESKGTVLGVGKWEYALGDKVVKPKGSWWCGTIVGFYSTRDTPRGYAVQYPTMHGNGAVQIYPESALELDT